MQPRTFKPCSVGWRRVQVNDGGKPEPQIGTWNLRAIGSPKLGVGTDCVVVQGGRVAHMHMRIDQSGYEKSPAPVDSPYVRTSNQMGADLNDLAVANDDICTRQGGLAFRRDQSDIFDYYALIDNALRVHGGRDIENDQPSQYSGPQSMAQVRPLTLPTSLGWKTIRTAGLKVPLVGF